MRRQSGVTVLARSSLGPVFGEPLRRFVRAKAARWVGPERSRDRLRVQETRTVADVNLAYHERKATRA